MTMNTVRSTVQGQVNVLSAAREQGILAAGQAATLSDAKGKTIVCTSGWLWLTFENDLNDYVLAAGKALEIDTQEKLVVSCPGGGSYRLD